MVKKTAVKRVMIQKPASFIRDFNDAQKLGDKLELDLKKLRQKLSALCMKGFIPGPPSPKK